MSTQLQEHEAIRKCTLEVQSEQTMVWRCALVELAMREGQLDPDTAVRDVCMTHSARMQ